MERGRTFAAFRRSIPALCTAACAWSAGCASAPRPLVEPTFAARTYTPIRIALLPPDVFVVVDQFGPNDAKQSAALGQGVSQHTVKMLTEALRSRGYDVDLQATWDGISDGAGNTLVSRDELGWLANSVLQFANGPVGGDGGTPKAPIFVAPELAAKVGWATASDSLMYVNVKGVTVTDGKRTAQVLSVVFFVALLAALVYTLSQSQGGSGPPASKTSAQTNAPGRTGGVTRATPAAASTGAARAGTPVSGAGAGKGTPVSGLGRGTAVSSSGSSAAPSAITQGGVGLGATSPGTAASAGVTSGGLGGRTGAPSAAAPGPAPGTSIGKGTPVSGAAPGSSSGAGKGTPVSGAAPGSSSGAGKGTPVSSAAPGSSSGAGKGTPVSSAAPGSSSGAGKGTPVTGSSPSSSQAGLGKGTPVGGSPSSDAGIDKGTPISGAVGHGRMEPRSMGRTFGGPRTSLGIGVYVPIGGPVYTHDGAVADTDDLYNGDEIWVSMTLVSATDGRVLWHVRDHVDLEPDRPADIEALVSRFVGTIPYQGAMTAPPTKK